MAFQKIKRKPCTIVEFPWELGDSGRAQKRSQVFVTLVKLLSILKIIQQEL
jgi:hypothetical protein